MRNWAENVNQWCSYLCDRYKIASKENAFHPFYLKQSSKTEQQNHLLLNTPLKLLYFCQTSQKSAQKHS